MVEWMSGLVYEWLSGWMGWVVEWVSRWMGWVK